MYGQSFKEYRDLVDQSKKLVIYATADVSQD